MGLVIKEKELAKLPVYYRRTREVSDSSHYRVYVWKENEKDFPYVAKFYHEFPNVGCPKCNRHAHQHGRMKIGGKQKLVCPGDWVCLGASGDIIILKPEVADHLFDDPFALTA